MYLKGILGLIIVTSLAGCGSESGSGAETGSGASTGASSGSTTSYFGYTYAIENSIRVQDDDDNPSLEGHQFTPIDATYNQLSYILSEASAAYTWEDVTSFNARLSRTSTSGLVQKITKGTTLYLDYHGYLAAFNLYDDGGSRSRITMIMKATSSTDAPYSLVRPTSDFDFNLIKGKTFSGWNVDPDGSSNSENFTIAANVVQNTMTFGNTINDNISIKVRGVTLSSDIKIFTGASSGTLAKHATYVGKSSDNNTIVAIVVSPDGKAISVAICDDAACIDNVANPLQDWFMINPAGIAALTYSVMGSF